MSLSDPSSIHQSLLWISEVSDDGRLYVTGSGLVEEEKEEEAAATFLRPNATMHELEVNSIKLWDAQTGACLKTMLGHAKAVNLLCFFEGGKRICSGSLDGTIRVWNCESGRCEFIHSESLDDIQNICTFSNAEDDHMVFLRNESTVQV